MATKTKQERAEQMLAFDAWSDSQSVAFEPDFDAGWAAGVAWVRATERRRLQDCHHITPCTSAETCYLKTEE